jgi:WD40 repeat protein
MATLSQGMIPVFSGLSAQRIPDNPDTNSEAQRLLLQFHARSYKTSSGSNANERQSLANPRSEVICRNEVPFSGVPLPPPSSSPLSQQSRQVSQPRQTPQTHQVSQPHRTQSASSQHAISPRPAPSSSSSELHVPSQRGSRGSRGSRDSQVASSSSRNQVPLHLVSSLRILSSPQLVPPYRSGDTRQRTLRESVAITNANKSDEMNPVSLPDTRSQSVTSSRSVSPIEQSSIRRSGRSRAQPINYYARIRLGSEGPEPIQEAPVMSSIRPQEPTRVPPRCNMQKFLCGRELGGIPIDTEMMSDLEPWKSWKGASGDILSLTWSPEDTRFAAGAAARTDQYNRRNNLVLGDVRSSRLKEIPDHCIPRPAASPVDDPYLYMSVPDMQWVGDRLYTASFDKTVKIWDARHPGNISCIQTLKHDSQVEMTAISSFDGILATGTTSIMIWDTRDLENPTSTTLHLDRDTRYRPHVNFSSSALAWGNTPFTKEFLAGGMSEHEGDEPSYKGHLGLWRAREDGFETIKVLTNSQNIHDLKWHPCLSQFATASPEDPYNARSKGIGTTTKSIVRVFSLNCDLTKRVPSIMEFSSPAYDTNQVTFCPTDGRYMSASCTNGTTYVWDNRKGDRILHELHHGDPINPIAHDRSREMIDVGVRVALWGTAGQFYTGASDGVLKRWDIRRSTEDALLQNIASFQDEIMSASFSHDQSHLLVGDSGGAVHVLSSGPCADPEITEFQFEHAPDSSGPNEVDLAGYENLPTFDTGGDFSQPFSQSTFSESPRSKKKRRREEQRRLKAELYEFAQPRLGADGEEPIVTGVNGVDRPDESSGEERAQRLQAERKERRRKKRRLRRMQPIINNTESIDLTVDSESESPHRFDLEQLLEALEEDHWFPPSGQIDPNFTEEIV